jgi:hypothetical protein
MNLIFVQVNQGVPRLDREQVDIKRIKAQGMSDQTKPGAFSGSPFPEDLMFRLTNREFAILKYQIGASSLYGWGGRRE